MDACCILFGRSCQFDKNGVKITLLPLNNVMEPKTCKVEGKTLLTLAHLEKEFEVAYKDSEVIYCLIVKYIFTLRNQWSPYNI